MTMPDSVSGVAGKPRDVNYDLLRVVAMCLVIGVHVINNYMPVKMTLAGSAETVRSVLFALFMVCNPLFIMVSGRFNLTFDADRPVSTRSSGNLPGSGSDARAGGGAGQADPGSLAPYARYYDKRFVSLIVPYLLYAGGMGFVAYLVIDHRSVGGAVSGTLFDLFSGYDDSVYWFVFMLAGFVLATPFLAAMMRAIGRSGAWLLIGLAAAVAAAARLWARHVLDGVNAALQAERSCVFPGEPCPLRVTLDNPKWLPLVWLTVRFPLEPGGALRPEHRWETVELPEGGVQKPYYEKNVSFLLGHQRMSYTSRLQAEHRGLLSFDRIRLLSGDGLCLCVREKEIPLPRPVTLAVFPRLVPVSTRWFLRNSWELETGARGFQDDRTVIRNVRAYQPGDNARSLNFRLMARGQGAMVNIYEKISPRRAAFLLDGASFAGLPPEDFESALEILGSLAAQLMEEEVAVSLLISRPAGRLEQFATCRDRRQLPAVLTLLAAADTAVSITADEILPRLRTLSGAFLICGDVRRLDAGTCALLERHRVPLLAWGEQSHPLLRVLDLNAFRAGGGL